MANILLLDDDSFFLHTAARVLMEEGHHVRPTARVQYAARIAETLPFEVLIVGYKPLTFDTLMLVRRIRELQPQCRRILVSSIISSDLVDAALRCGDVQQFFSKPVGIRRLAEVIALQETDFHLAFQNSAGALNYAPIEDVGPSMKGRRS